MNTSNAAPPWMTAWLDAGQELARLAGASYTRNDPPGAEALRRLAGFGQEFAGVAADCWNWAQSPAPDAEGLRASLVERYLRLLTPLGLPESGATPAAGTEMLRFHEAALGFGREVAAIALDAAGRFSSVLAAPGEGAPITTLRELHDVWIDCGEAAYAAAAHGDDYAEAQAEYLAALVELRRVGPRP